MSKIILKIKDLYCEWDTEKKKPSTRLMPLQEFKIIQELNNPDVDKSTLNLRLKRAEEKGHSVIGSSKSIEELIKENRAGFKGESLTSEELVRQYADKNSKIRVLAQEIEEKQEEEDKIPFEEKESLKIEESPLIEDILIQQIKEIENKNKNIDNYLDIILENIKKDMDQVVLEHESKLEKDLEEIERTFEEEIKKAEQENLL